MGNLCKDLPININNVKDAYKTIKDEVRKTPLIKSFSLSANNESEVYLKLENLQLAGSFKFRGAFNKISSLTEEEKARGVIACSAGNHSQGVALASKLLGVKAKIIMPETAPASKVAATRGYGAEVVQHGRAFDDARALSLELAESEGLTFLDPYDDPYVMAGQGTIGLEIIQDLWDVDTVITPIGGGGLVSGLAVTLKSFNPDVKIVGVQSDNVHGMKASVEEGKVVGHMTDLSWADGAAVKTPGELTFQVVQKLVDEIVTVSEHEIEEGMKFLIQRGKQIAEGSGALPIAAVQTKKVNQDYIKGKKVVCVVSGGNVDLSKIVQMIEDTAE